MNLWTETLEKLKEYGKNWQADVYQVGSKDFRITKPLFRKLADKEYDNGYGAPEVATDLIIEGEDWWLERHEYDGSEWWEFKTMPRLMEKPICYDVKTLVGREGWETLKKMNISYGKEEI